MIEMLRAEDGRLRVWLRILLLLMAVAIGVGGAQAVAKGFDPPRSLLVEAILVAVVGVGLFVLLAPRLDRRTLRSYGLRLGPKWAIDLSVGLLIGASVGATAGLSLLAGGWAEVNQFWSDGAAGSMIGATLGFVVLNQAAVGVWEELVFRGYILTNLAEAISRRRAERHAVVIAWLVSSLIFAALHANQLLSPQAVPTIALLWLTMGGLFGLAYIFTGGLALPIGLHAGGNLGLGILFGRTDGFAAESAALVRLEVDGPAWLVSVGGLAHLGGVCVAYLLVWWWLRRRGPESPDWTNAVVGRMRTGDRLMDVPSR